MLKFTLQRVGSLVPTLLLLTMLVFALLALSPGDPAAIIAGPEASPDAIENIRRGLGLDDPLLSRYASFVGGLLHGDLGTSYRTNEEVVDMIARRLPRTFSLTALALLLSVIISIPLGVLSAVRKSSVVDRSITVFSVTLIAIPPFVLAAILLSLFSFNGLQIFPPTGYSPVSEGIGEWFRFAILPALIIASTSMAELTRMLRGSLVDAFEQDYIRTARAKGLSRVRVVGKHAAKNAAVPYVTILGHQVGRMLGAAVIVEAIFNIPGFGQLGVEAVIQRDFPVVQGVVLVSGLMVVATNLLVDMSYGYLSPRTRAR